MSTNTPNYQLLKPDPSENVNVVSQINDNYDTIDTELKRVDDVAAADGVWADYTPTWTGAGSNPALNNGTLTARYCRVKKFVYVKLRLVIGTTTTLGTGTWSFSLPIVPSATHAGLETFGTCLSLAGSYRHDVITIASGSSNFQMIGVAAGAFYTNTVPAAWASGNFLNTAFCYEVA